MPHIPRTLRSRQRKSNTGRTDQPPRLFTIATQSLVTLVAVAGVASPFILQERSDADERDRAADAAETQAEQAQEAVEDNLACATALQRLEKGMANPISRRTYEYLLMQDDDGTAFVTANEYNVCVADEIDVREFVQTKLRHR